MLRSPNRRITSTDWTDAVERLSSAQAWYGASLRHGDAATLVEASATVIRARARVEELRRFSAAQHGVEHA